MTRNYVIKMLEDRKDELSWYVDIMVELVIASRGQGIKLCNMVEYRSLINLIMNREKEAILVIEQVQTEAIAEVEESERVEELRDFWLGGMMRCRDKNGRFCAWSERCFIKA